jgi:gamma-glutamyltranspeptidase/glutathione hydrolase
MDQIQPFWRSGSLHAALACALLAAQWLAAHARNETGDKPAECRNGMVVSVSGPGSDAGLEILKKGGNAVDAAVATAFALAVTYPQAGNIGGGGFMLIHPGRGAEPVVIEYREAAPSAASKTMFSRDDSSHGCKVVGVPGTVRGLHLAHQRFGKLPWSTVLQPAIRLAEKGFILEGFLAGSLNGILAKAKQFPEFQRVFSKPASRAVAGDECSGGWQADDTWVQQELAETLKLIASQGADAFYTGIIATQIEDTMKQGGGLITRRDLAAYRAHIVQPIHGTYRGFDVYAPPPPSSGGVCLAEMLNILENFNLREQSRWSPQTLHLMIEAMRRAYCDRARFLGDPDFVTIPSYLTGKDYARDLARAIDRHKATPSEALAKDIPLAAEGDNTTHFSVIDKDGMAVANTYTLEHSYGSRVVVRGAGFLLNNEMTDFNWRPGVTDRKGTIGTEPNQIAPGKRMLSSQTPTIVARNGKVVLITGSPGSRTIINTVLCILVNVLDFNMEIGAAVAAPRLHHQWFPDTARFEGLREYPSVVKSLQQMGHRMQGIRQGDAHSIWVDSKTGHYVGAPDRRINGKVAGY